MKKIAIRITLIIITIFLIIKLFHFLVIYKINKNIEKFVCEDNRYYSVESGNQMAELIKVNNKVKYNLYYQGKIIYTQIRNLGSYELQNINKEFGNEVDEKLNTNFKENLYNIPTNICTQNIFLQTFYVRFITLSKDNEKKNIHIYTRDEEIIIDKDTYLPVCNITKCYNNQNELEDNKISYYKFEINCISDKDF